MWERKKEGQRGGEKKENFLQSHNLLLTDGSLSPDSQPSPIANRGYCVIAEHRHIPKSLMQRYCEQVREQRKLCCMPENAAKTNTDVSIRCVAVISFQIQKLQEDDKIPCTDVEFGAPLWVPAVKSVSLFLYSSMETG